eukprot:1619872-Amphidinium_carterae.2
MQLNCHSATEDMRSPTPPEIQEAWSFWVCFCFLSLWSIRLHVELAIGRYPQILRLTPGPLMASPDCLMVEFE